MIRRARLVLLPFAFGAGLAQAGDVYKCTTPDGGIAYQDRPCAPGETETRFHVVAPPPATPAPTSGEGGEGGGENPESGSATPPPNAPLPPQQQGPLPALWLCTRAEDGSSYVSRDGATPPRMVPAGVLGIPGQSLAQAYGPGGVGVSAPGVRPIPIDTSPQSAIAAGYVAVQDRCVPATKEQTCTWLQQRFVEVQQKLRRAFKDEAATLKPQEEQLRNELDGC
jgi:hypothetical protein